MAETLYDTPTLSVAVEDNGTGAPMILLHGWPDDPRTWDSVLPALHEAGWRTIVPYLRGFGRTTFRPGATVAGDLEALGQDVVDLMDAMGLQTAVLVGHDWGARAAYIATHMAPERVEACVALSTGWGTNLPGQSLSWDQLQRYWYHWLFATSSGARLVHDDRRGLARHIWDIWAGPKHPLSQDDFGQTAPSFDNPAWPEITIKSYATRWGNAPTDPAYEAIRAAQRADPVITVPTLVIHGAVDPVSPPSLSEGKDSLFRARYERVLLDDVGHFPSRENPQAVAERILGFVGRPAERAARA